MSADSLGGGSLAKGAFGGLCNRTVCQRPGATFYNRSTRKHYCEDCADLLNRENAVDAHRLFGGPLCIPGVGSLGSTEGTPPPIRVLDHGFVRLVDAMGSDISVVRAARVSYDAAWRAGEDEKSDARLIRYLWRNHHTTPFEAVTLTFEVKAPIFIFRQWHRHRTWSYNELSARYRELPEEFYVPSPGQIGIQHATNKQARDVGADVDMHARCEETKAFRTHCEAAFSTYRDLLVAGWPRELARAVLPVSTYSHMFATVNLLNLFRFLTLRCDTHAQYEIQLYATAMLQLANDVAPVCCTAWREART